MNPAHYLQAFLWVLASLQLQAQSEHYGKDLSPVVFHEVLQYKDSVLKMQDFRGKLVIFDLWGPNCLGCLQAFPKLDSLQQMFSNELQIILVNRENKKATETFFAQRKKLVPPRTPMITSDTLLTNLVAALGFPLSIWVDTTGRIRYALEGYRTTTRKIREFLQTGELKLKERAVRYTIVPSLFPPETEDRMAYYSHLSHCNPEVIVNETRQGEGCWLVANGQSVQNLLLKAYEEGGKYAWHRPGRLVLEVPHGERWTAPPGGDAYDIWREEDCFTYELFLPKEREKEKFRFMQEDLCRFFGITVHRELRPVKTFVLVRTGTADRLRSRGGASEDRFYPASVSTVKVDSLRSVRNLPFVRFIEKLTGIFEYDKGLPFEDQTGYQGSIDLSVPGEVLDNWDLKGLNQALKKYGLCLMQKALPREVLVIRPSSP